MILKDRLRDDRTPRERAGRGRAESSRHKAPTAISFVQLPGVTNMSAPRRSSVDLSARVKIVEQGPAPTREHTGQWPRPQ